MTTFKTATNAADNASAQAPAQDLARRIAFLEKRLGYLALDPQAPETSEIYAMLRLAKGIKVNGKSLGDDAARSRQADALELAITRKCEAIIDRAVDELVLVLRSPEFVSNMQIYHRQVPPEIFSALSNLRQQLMDVLAGKRDAVEVKCPGIHDPSFFYSNPILDAFINSSNSSIYKTGIYQSIVSGTIQNDRIIFKRMDLDSPEKFGAAVDKMFKELNTSIPHSNNLKQFCDDLKRLYNREIEEATFFIDIGITSVPSSAIIRDENLSIKHLRDYHDKMYSARDTSERVLFALRHLGADVRGGVFGLFPMVEFNDRESSLNSAGIVTLHVRRRPPDENKGER